MSWINVDRFFHFVLPSEKEQILRVKFWTAIVCCTILAYVQSYVNVVNIQYLVYLVKLVKFFLTNTAGSVIDSGK